MLKLSIIVLNPTAFCHINKTSVRAKIFFTTTRFIPAFKNHTSSRDRITQRKHPVKSNCSVVAVDISIAVVHQSSTLHFVGDLVAAYQIQVCTRDSQTQAPQAVSLSTYRKNNVKYVSNIC